MAGIIPDVSLIDNSDERTLLVLVLDCSGSMQGAPIKMLHDGLKQLDIALKEDPITATRGRICVIAFGGDDEVGVTEWQDAIDFEPPEPDANGSTPMGRAVHVALEEIEAQKEEMRAAGVAYKRPIMMLMSDGEPSEEKEVWEGAAAECMAAEAANKVTVFVIAVGDEAKKPILNQFSAKGVRPMPMNKNSFKEFFIWLSRSVRAVSKAANGELAQLPPIDGWSSSGTNSN